MTRKTHAGILVAVLVTGIFAIIPQTPSIHGQSIIVVDDDVPDVDCLEQYGGGVRDFSTIGGAINDPGTSPGDTIVVCPGTYAEHVQVNKDDDIRLTGFGCGRTIIDPDPDFSSNGISISQDGTTVEGFEIRNGINGIESASGTEIDRTIIKHNCIHHNDEDGINMKRGSDNLMFDNEVFKNGDEGIFLGEPTSLSNRNWVGNNEVHNNTANGIRMQVTSSTDNEINDNEVRDNGVWGIDVDSDILVKHNIATGNVGGYVVRGSGNALVNNDAIKNDENGFRIIGDSNTISKNTAKMNGIDGFSTSGGLNIFTDNLAKANTRFGFFTNGDDNTFTKNKANKNTEEGFFVEDGATGNEFTENSARNNAQNGFFTNGDDNTFTKNKGISNTFRGFSAGGSSSGNDFTENKSKNNGTVGFGDQTVPIANTYTDNKCSDGFFALDGTAPALCAP